MRKQPKFYTTWEAAVVLGLKRRPIVVQNWLQGGSFPGSHRNEDGEWRFEVDAVWRVVYAIAERRRNIALGNVSIPDHGDDDLDIPLL